MVESNGLLFASNENDHGSNMVTTSGKKGVLGDFILNKLKINKGHIATPF